MHRPPPVPAAGGQAAEHLCKHLAPTSSVTELQTSHLAAKFKANTVTARVVRSGACSMRRTYREKLFCPDKAGATNAASMQKTKLVTRRLSID